MIKYFIEGQEQEIHDLVKSVFDDFVGNGYSEEGNKVFSDFIKPEEILNRCKNNSSILTYNINNKIIGMIELRGENHISQFFVNSDFHNAGVGRQLFKAALDIVKKDFITVKASPYSVKIYEKLGFNKTGELEEDHGIKFIPMVFKNQ